MIRFRQWGPAAAAVLVLVAAGQALAEVTVGSEAPDFTLKDQAGEDVQLSSFRGKKHVLIAFYPKDHSPGCTNQMKCYVRERRKVEALDVVTLAISGDATDTHKAFASALGITFKLLSDTDYAVTRQYGVFAQTATGGFATRSVFLVDMEGKVRHIDRDYRVPRTLVGTELMKKMKALSSEKDPAVGLDDLPEPERGAKKLLVAFVKAFVAEDIKAIDGLHHRAFGTREGETPAMQRERRKARIQGFRDLFKRQDVKQLKFADVLKLGDVRVFTKETAKPVKLGGLSTAAKAMATGMTEDDVMVVGRTSAPRLNGEAVLAREVAFLLRKQSGAWKIYAVAGK